MVKLALSGLDGIETSKVKIGNASVVYYPEELKAKEIVATINGETYFTASLASDGEYDPAKEEKRDDCRWYQLRC